MRRCRADSPSQGEFDIKYFWYCHKLLPGERLSSSPCGISSIVCWRLVEQRGEILIVRQQDCPFAVHLSDGLGNHARPNGPYISENCRLYLSLYGQYPASGDPVLRMIIPSIYKVENLVIQPGLDFCFLAFLKTLIEFPNLLH